NVLDPRKAEGVKPGDPPCVVDAANNVFDFRPEVYLPSMLTMDQQQALTTDGVPELPADKAEEYLRRMIGWRGRFNLYPTGVELLRLRVRYQELATTRPRTDLNAWQQFWGMTE